MQIGDFDVFDEWGNYMGKFTPSGGFDGCLATIAVMIAIQITVLILILFRIVTEGFKALFRGEWKSAMVGLSPIWATFVIALASYLFVISPLNPDVIRDNRMNYAIANPNESFSLIFDKCTKGYCFFSVTNNTRLRVWMSGNYYSECALVEGNVLIDDQVLRKKSSGTIRCKEGEGPYDVIFYLGEGPHHWTRLAAFDLQSK